MDFPAPALPVMNRCLELLLINSKALANCGFISICCGMAFPVVKFENDDSIIIGLNK